MPPRSNGGGSEFWIFVELEMVGLTRTYSLLLFIDPSNGVICLEGTVEFVRFAELAELSADDAFFMFRDPNIGVVCREGAADTDAEIDDGGGSELKFQVSATT